MSIRRFFVHDLTILRAAVVEDRYEDTALDWENATPTAVRGWLTQTSSDEENDHRDATITRAFAFLPAGTDVRAGDRILDELLGHPRTWEVYGEPNIARTPRRVHHVEAALRAAEG